MLLLLTFQVTKIHAVKHNWFCFLIQISSPNRSSKCFLKLAFSQKNIQLLKLQQVQVQQFEWASLISSRFHSPIFNTSSCYTVTRISLLIQNGTQLLSSFSVRSISMQPNGLTSLEIQLSLNKHSENSFPSPSRLMYVSDSSSSPAASPSSFRCSSCAFWEKPKPCCGWHASSSDLHLLWVRLFAAICHPNSQTIQRM